MTFLVKKLNPNILTWQVLVLHCQISLTMENPVFQKRFYNGQCLNSLLPLKCGSHVGLLGSSHSSHK